MAQETADASQDAGHHDAKQEEIVAANIEVFNITDLGVLLDDIHDTFFSRIDQVCDYVDAAIQNDGELPNDGQISQVCPDLYIFGIFHILLYLYIICTIYDVHTICL